MTSTVVNKNELKRQLEQFAHGRGWKEPVVLGLTGNDIQNLVANGRDFLYIDHSYLNRGWHNGMFRLTRGWTHLTRILPRPDDRFRKFNVKVEPWRKTGEKVVVIPPTPFQCAIGEHGWTDRTVARLRQITDRPVVVKHSKGGLPEFLTDAWCVVTWASVAGMEAMLMGIPVFAASTCCCAPVSSGPLENVERPEYPDREPWLHSLAYASWHRSELDIIRYQDYDYSYRDDVPQGRI